MVRIIKKTVSVLMLAFFVFVSCAMLTGCGESEKTHEFHTKLFTDRELLNLLEDEEQLVRDAVLLRLSMDDGNVNAIGNYDIAKWEYDGETYTDSGIGKYHAYGTCSAFDKYGVYYDSYRFEAIVEVKEVNSYHEYFYVDDYSSSQAAWTMKKYIENLYSIHNTVEVFSKY